MQNTIYLEKINENNNGFNIVFWWYLSQLKCILKIEKNIFTHRKKEEKYFEQFDVIYNNLKTVCMLTFIVKNGTSPCKSRQYPKDNKNHL